MRLVGQVLVEVRTRPAAFGSTARRRARRPLAFLLRQNFQPRQGECGRTQEGTAGTPLADASGSRTNFGAAAKCVRKGGKNARLVSAIRGAISAGATYA